MAFSEHEEKRFRSLPRDQFRDVFQPSRVVLGVFNDESLTRPNIIALCFNMHCSYDPPMMAFSVRQDRYTYKLLEHSQECVLAIPGEKLANAAIVCGTESGANCDKWVKAGLTPQKCEHISVPGIRECIANTELKILHHVSAGSHRVVIGQVLKYGVDETNKELPLLSIGKHENGYRLLIKHGIHRLAVVEGAVQGSSSMKPGFASINFK